MKSKDQLKLEEAYRLVQLNELFDSRFEYKISSDERQQGGIVATTIYTFSSAEPDQNGKVAPFPKYIVQFDKDLEDASVKISFACQLTPESGITYEMTGTGNAPKVMGTIMAIVKEYLEDLLKELKDLDWDILLSSFITFSAKSSEKGKVKFYNTLASLLIRYLDQKSGIHWQLIEEPGPENKEYIIKPKPSSQQPLPGSSLSNSSLETTPTKRSTERFL